MKQQYALTDWVVERRSDGWYFTTYHNRRNRDWQGPYSSEASVALMVARQLRREIAARSEQVAA